jgi:hypothetical protein
MSKFNGKKDISIKLRNPQQFCYHHFCLALSQHPGHTTIDFAEIQVTKDSSKQMG